jgi:hypothetical protein
MHPKFAGLALMLSAVGFLGYTQYPSSADREENLATVTRIITQSATTDGRTALSAEQPGYRQPLTTYGTPLVQPAPQQLSEAGQSIVEKTDIAPSSVATGSMDIAAAVPVPRAAALPLTCSAS